MNPESTLLSLPVNNPPTQQLSGTAGGAIGEQAQSKVQVYTQRKLECRLKDCPATLTFLTHSMSDGVYLSADVTLKVKQRGYSSGARDTRIVFVLAKIDGRCHVSRNKWEDTVWLDGASFKIDARDIEGAFEFLASLGLPIDDTRAQK